MCGIAARLLVSVRSRLSRAFLRLLSVFSLLRVAVRPPPAVSLPTTTRGRAGKCEFAQHVMLQMFADFAGLYFVFMVHSLSSPIARPS